VATYKHFYELPVYKLYRLFRKLISDIAGKFPAQEEYRLKQQVLNSSRSVTANIAEGFGRYHYQENIQFCRQARGSLTETMDHMIVAYDEGYINKEVLGEVNKKYKDCLLALNSYVKYLRSAKASAQLSATNK